MQINRSYSQKRTIKIIRAAQRWLKKIKSEKRSVDDEPCSGYPADFVTSLVKAEQHQTVDEIEDYSSKLNRIKSPKKIAKIFKLGK